MNSAGMTRIKPSSTASGVAPRAKGMRFATRKTCVSTAMTGSPKAMLSTTLAVLRPTPGSEVPAAREALEALPGVGRKTANVVLNVAFGEPTMAVDTHIFRVANRTGLAPGRNPLQVELNLLRRVPAKYLVDAHHWLILHGRYVCQARKPLCWQCQVAPWCDYKPKTAVP